MIYLLLAGIFLIIFGALFFIRDNDGYNTFGYNSRGFKANKRHRNGTLFDNKGLDFRGFSKENKLYLGKMVFDKKGFDFEGFNQKGFNAQGFDRSGYNVKGFNEAGFNADGFDEQGYDRQGFNRKGYNRFGFNNLGYNIDGFDKYGFNIHGYDSGGYDKAGYNKQGYNRKGYNRDGFNAQGFNEKGFDRFGFDKEGFALNGYNVDGVDRQGATESYDYWFMENYFQCFTSDDDDVIDFLSIKPENVLIKVFSEHTDQIINTQLPAKISRETFHEDSYIITPFTLLGLNINATQKEIVRRGNDISKLKSIESEIKFPRDIFELTPYREENVMKNTVRIATDSELKIPFMFFSLGENHLDSQLKGIKTLESLINDTFVYALKNQSVSQLKNGLILAGYYAILKKDAEILRPITEDWKSVIESAKFWQDFLEKYTSSLIYDQNLDAFKKFKTNIKNFLATYYYQLYEAIEDPEVLKIFYEDFEFYPQEFFDKVIIPELSNLSVAIDAFDNDDLFFSNKQITSAAEKRIETFLSSIQKIQKLIADYSIETNSDVIRVMEKAVTKLRSIAIDVLNNSERGNRTFKYGEGILQQALNLAQSDVMINRIKKDFKDIEEQKLTDKLQDEIVRAINDGELTYALTKINELEKITTSSDILQSCAMLKRKIRDSLFRW